MQDEKSQLQNKDRAMRVLRARLYEQKLAEQQAEIASERKAQVGTGERSEKIRTYNFPQGRVTDHRIKHTSHDLDGVLGGRPGRVHRALAAEEKRLRLEAQSGRRRPTPRDRGLATSPCRLRQRRRGDRGGRQTHSAPPASTRRGSTRSCC